MPNWSEVLNEMQQINAEADQELAKATRVASLKKAGALDAVRRSYLKQLSDHTGRNVIAYYSGWLQGKNQGVEIRDDDKNGFMNAIHRLDRRKGLDLLIHTPGGDLTATESIVNYLHEMFSGDIRAFIPQIAMSAGTMMACACKEIWMGVESNLGPIDPQFNSIPAHGVIEEFTKAIKETSENPASIPMWQTIIGKYHPSFIGECEKAIELSSIICREWLIKYMLSSDSKAEEKATKIVDSLNNHDSTKTHSRHIHLDEAESFGLVIRRLEEPGQEILQDLILTVHHAYMHTFANSGVSKTVENHDGSAIFYTM